MDFTKELDWRGLISDETPGIRDIVSSEKITGYIGFDPTSKSLHIGNLLPIMNLVRLQKYGHKPLAVVGGGTGLIGDPSGKSSERNILSKESIQENLDSIKSQLEKFLDFSESIKNPAVILNNAEWLEKINYLDFLRDTGKHFTINYMMKKESVKSRLSRDTGISYTEFSYMTLQAYDYLYLYENYNYLLSRIIILTAIVISLKAFYLIYILLIIPVLIYQKDRFLFLKNFFLLKATYFSVFFSFIVLFTYFINSGCFIYPLSLSCTNVTWAIPLNEVNNWNQYYQLWAKAGAAKRIGPNDEEGKYWNDTLTVNLFIAS